MVPGQWRSRRSLCTRGASAGRAAGPADRLNRPGFSGGSGLPPVSRSGSGGRPTSAPPFPRARRTPTDEPRFAGALPGVWQVPPRNPRFTGRDAMLTELRRLLHADENTLVLQALYGPGPRQSREFVAGAADTSVIMLPGVRR